MVVRGKSGIPVNETSEKDDNSDNPDNESEMDDNSDNPDNGSEMDDNFDSGLDESDAWSENDPEFAVPGTPTNKEEFEKMQAYHDGEKEQADDIKDDLSRYSKAIQHIREKESRSDFTDSEWEDYKEFNAQTALPGSSEEELIEYFEGEVSVSQSNREEHITENLGTYDSMSNLFNTRKKHYEAAMEKLNRTRHLFEDTENNNSDSVPNLPNQESSNLPNQESSNLPSQEASNLPSQEASYLPNQETSNSSSEKPSKGKRKLDDTDFEPDGRPSKRR